jgi:hypothetical protein
MAYDNTNRWTLNKAANKQQDSHADYQGKINVEGKEYWLNGWIKDGPNGKFISGNIKPIGEQMASTGRHSYTPGGKVRREDPISTGRPRRNDDMSDDIPFHMEWRG